MVPEISNWAFGSVDLMHLSFLWTSLVLYFFLAAHSIVLLCSHFVQGNAPNAEVLRADLKNSLRKQSPGERAKPSSLKAEKVFFLGSVGGLPLVCSYWLKLS